MTQGMQTILFPVKDLAAARSVFDALLGVQPVVDESYYVGYRVAGQDVGLDPNGHARGMTGAVAYWQVNDIRQRLQSLLDAGAMVQEAISDVGGGKLVATVKDTEGNLIGLLQPAA